MSEELDVYGNPKVKSGYIRLYALNNSYEDVTVEEYDQRLLLVQNKFRKVNNAVRDT